MNESLIQQRQTQLASATAEASNYEHVVEMYRYRRELFPDVPTERLAVIVSSVVKEKIRLAELLLTKAQSDHIQ